ncbi:uncharacterized protein KY384_001268 [Bacidia gigantensis]|uniref:uncharacterized protein n=1 Tax=Bacidia gigantensis TaxID=2732470 RepID=UPI001D04E399|nr:uncharacterized protein KY384_001268 [Bacidia gigantensis]KAG8533528.1 hypothetical protein KY384_001268 [Bacidia gigantensis]
MPHWEVHSFQLNIDEGDCAVHLLVDEKQSPKNIDKAVLIDGGKAYGAACILDFRTIMSRIDSDYSQGTNDYFRTFDAIVISHWDSDHREGIVQVLQTDVKTGAQQAILDYQIKDQAGFNVIVNDLKIKSTLTKYDGAHGEPSTVLYAPYWRLTDSRTRSKFNKTEKERPSEWSLVKALDGRLFVCVNVEVTSLSGNIVKGAIPVALWPLGETSSGGPLLGLDFFSGQVVMSAVDAKYPALVSQHMMANDYDKPVMMCVASDSWVCDPDGMDDRSKNWEWKTGAGDASDLTDVYLGRVKTNDVDSNERSRRLFENVSSSDDDISIASVKGYTTGNNQSSIACMIIWANTDCEISLYTGGDLGDEMEEHVLRWSATPSPTDANVRTPPLVDIVKLSHHVFLTKYLLLDQVGYVNTGAIGSLTESMGLEWRTIINRMWKVVNTVADQVQPRPTLPVNLVGLQILGNEKEAKTFIAKYLDEWWNICSFIPWQWFGGWGGFQNGMFKAAAQRIRFHVIKQAPDRYFVAEYAIGTSFLEFEISWLADINYKNFVAPIEDRPGHPKTFKAPVNDKTIRSIETNRLAKKQVTGNLMDSATAQILISASENAQTLSSRQFADDSPGHDVGRGGTALVKREQHIRKGKMSFDPALCYFMATDAIETNGTVKDFRAKLNSNLDLFLSGLNTGAIVLPDKLNAQASELQLDGSDELFQWLLTIFGDFEDPKFVLQVKASTSNISSFSYTTRLDKALTKGISFTDRMLSSTMITFSTDNNSVAFNGASTPPPTWLGPPASGTADVDIDIIGPAFMLLMSLNTNSGIEQAVITGEEVVNLFEVKLPTIINFLTPLLSLKVDTSAGTKCGLWFFPDALYTTTLRLHFKGADGDPTTSFASKLKGTVQEITSVANIDIGDPRIVAKKTWRRSQDPAKAASADVESVLVIFAPMTFHRQDNPTGNLVPKLESFTVDTALEILPEKTRFTLTFDASKGGTSVTDILELFVSLIPGSPQLPSFADYLPGIENILLRRITYIVPTKGEKVVSLDLQAAWSSIVLQCTLKYTFGRGGGGEFGGNLFLNDPQTQLGPQFSFVPYMPDYETWTALAVIPKSKGGSDGRQIGDLGDIYSTLTKAEGQEKKLNNPPISLQLLALSFYVSSQNLQFNAIVISPKPDEESTPQIRLDTASLDVQFKFDSKKPQLQKVALYSNFVLASPKLDEYSTLSASLEYTSSKWTLTGSAGRLSGALLYSLFDSDCDEEMVELLKDISLDVAIVYNYDSTGKGSDFVISGDLYLGPVTLDYSYEYKGKTAAVNEPIWRLTANLSVNEGNGTLVDVIGAICGTDTSQLLPSWLKNVGVKTSQDTKLTSLRIFDVGTSILFVLRVQLADGASIACYRLSPKKKRTDDAPIDDKPPTTKTALILTVDRLPTVENIPLIGSLPQPFDEFSFAWVSGSDDESGGFTRADMNVIDKNRLEDDPELRYKDNVKEDQQKDDDVLLASGYHFIVVANKKIAMDYVFGQKKDDKSQNIAEESQLGIREVTTSPIDKTFGPVKIFGLGLGFDLSTNTLSIVIDGTLNVGPLAMTLLGFAINFSFEGSDLRNLSSIKPSFDLRGLSASFQQDPVLLQGMFERGVTPDGDPYFQGAATVGFTPYLFQAVGYYGKARDPKPAKQIVITDDEVFNTFFTYCRLDGPIMSIFGFAEISGLSGGFGYNSTIAFPNTQNLLTFPFIAPPDETDPSKALSQFFKGGWFTPKRDSYWIAAGFKVLAFEMLEVETVLTVEFGTGLKFGLFGLATAEMPKKVERKFVRVQLGLAATVDFDAGLLKIDGQLTPSSFVLDPSCHLTGGFAMYSWFDSRDSTLDGDWVFTVGGYHKSFKVPTQYPVPPRLGITWSFDNSINITGEAYFAINSKVCMGGGRLHIVMSAGPLYAYFDAYADFLINYKPFHFQAEGGISVGVHFSLDLWLVTIHINIDLAARLYLQGPPVNGTVHVDFYVFGFDVNFGEHQNTSPSKLQLEDFYRLALQADNKPTTSRSLLLKSGRALEDSLRAEDDPDAQLSPHIYSCTSGLIPSQTTKSSPSDMTWDVRAAVFAFDISCKFALTGAEVITKALEEDGNDATHTVPYTVADKMYARPMWLDSEFYRSQLRITIAKDVPVIEKLTEDPEPLNPEWNNNLAILTAVPTALWGAYNPNDDPSSGNNNISNLLDGTKGGTAKLLTGVSVRAPTPRISPDIISEFDVQVAMGKVAGLADFPCNQDAQKNWQPEPKSATPYEDVRKRWKAPLLGDDAGVKAAKTWCQYKAFGWGEEAVTGKRPEMLVDELEGWYTEAPRLSLDVSALGEGCEREVRRGLFSQIPMY